MTNKRGMLLTTAVILIAAVAVIVTGVYFMTNQQLTSGLKQANGEEALYYAESGINRYLWFLNEDPNFYITTEGIAMTGTDIAFEGGFYRLAIVPPAASNPVVTIQATGWPAADPSRKRTIQTAASKRAFVQNVFSTQSEVTPDNSNVWWVTGDIVNGPFHTNGNINIDGNPVFNGHVSYSGSVTTESGSHPIYNGGGPDRVEPLVFPSSNGDLKIWAQSPSGYYYTGQTSIFLNGTNVTIRNGNTTTTRPLPANGVIFVDGTGGTKWGQWDSPSTAGNVFVGGTLNGRLTIAAANDIFITNYNPTITPLSTADDTANVTGGVKYANQTVTGANPSDDMLGLVANGYVRILHYGWFGKNSNTDVAPDNITIQAAIFATTWAFEFENYDQGSLKDTITMTGSITQKYRGAVGTFSSWTGDPVTGYHKNYTHDPRMAYLSPPHFLEPLNSGWVLSGWHEIANP